MQPIQLKCPIIGPAAARSDSGSGLVSVVTPVPQALIEGAWQRVEWRDPAGIPVWASYLRAGPPPEPAGPANVRTITQRFPRVIAGSALRPGTPTRVRRPSTRTLYIVGMGPMGLALARCAALRAHNQSPPCRAVLIGRHVFGPAADPAVSVARCQGIIHNGGTLWACTAPETARAVRRGARMLAHLAPTACRPAVPAVGVLRDDAPVSGREYLEACRALGGDPDDFEILSLAAARRLLPGLPASVSAVLRIPERTVDIAALGGELVHAALAAGAVRIPADVKRLMRAGDRVCGIQLDDGSTVPVLGQDMVVLAAGPCIRTLAASVGVTFDSLRHFASALVATPPDRAPRALALSLFGGATLVPHPGSTLLGNAARVPIDTEYLRDGETAAALARSVILAARTELGVAAEVTRSWVGTKVEATSGDRCQDGAILTASGVRAIYAAIPGKMTSCLIAAERIVDAVLRPSWEGVGQGPISAA